MNACPAQAVTGMRHMDAACGQLIPIGGASPLLIGCNSTSPGVYLAFDPASLACQEYSFADDLQIDFCSPTAALDADGVTRIGAPFYGRQPFLVTS